jgi:hypothetical protein
VGRDIEPRCERIGRYYGYAPQDLAALAARGSSVAVPFFEIKRFFFVLETLGRHALGPAMIAAVERGERGTVEEHGNLVRVLPFDDPAFPAVREVFVKEDVSKNMVVYQPDGAIEHFGSEERAVLFAELAHRYFALGEVVPPAASGLLPSGSKYVVSAGLPRDRHAVLGEADGPRLRALWQSGLLPRVALMDFILGQKDRNANNVLLPVGGPVGDEAPLGLVDNDDTFGPHERLIDPFAYLMPLRDDATADFSGVRAWFAGLALPELVAVLAPLALPPAITAALCGRFVFAAAAVARGMSVAEFVQRGFTGGLAGGQPLADRPFAAYRLLVSERRGKTEQRHLLAAELPATGGGAATGASGGNCAVWVLDGPALGVWPVRIRAVPAGDVEDAAGVLERLEARAVADGFTQMPRRRLFVDGDTLRILEVRADPSGWHLVVRRGTLGHYADRLVERFVSFATEAEATTRADELEAELLAAGAADLRARLTAFKTAGERIQFF